MLQNRLISEIMTEDVQTVEKNKNLGEVIDILKEYSVHHVPVVSNGKLVGLVSLSDVLEFNINRLSQPGVTAELPPVEESTVEEVMETQLITLSTSSSVLKAAEILSQGEIHSIPITDDSGNLAGIVTSSDLINYLMIQIQMDL